MGGGKPAAGRGLWPILATPLLERASSAASTQFRSIWRADPFYSDRSRKQFLFRSRTENVV